MLEGGKCAGEIVTSRKTASDRTSSDAKRGRHGTAQRSRAMRSWPAMTPHFDGRGSIAKCSFKASLFYKTYSHSLTEAASDHSISEVISERFCALDYKTTMHLIES